MIKGQKSVRGGIEDFLCPFTDVFITQGPNENYSHKGIMAWDVRGAKAGIKYPYYAPATSKCIKTYPDSGQVMWQTVNNVRCPNGYIGKVTYMTCHDDTMDAKVGQIVNQGQKLGNMGKKGNATGVHCHIEFSQSADTTWRKNEYGNYMFNNEVDPENIFFMDNTNVVSGNGNWKYLKDVPVEEVKSPDKSGQDEEKTDSADQLQNTAEQLQKKLSEKEEIINNLTAGVTELTNTIIDKDKEIAALKEQLANAPKLIFTSPKLDYYAIKLAEKQKLYLG